MESLIVLEAVPTTADQLGAGQPRSLEPAPGADTVCERDLVVKEAARRALQLSMDTRQ